MFTPLRSLTSALAAVAVIGTGTGLAASARQATPAASSPAATAAAAAGSRTTASAAPAAPHAAAGSTATSAASSPPAFSPRPAAATPAAASQPATATAGTTAAPAQTQGTAIPPVAPELDGGTVASGTRIAKSTTQLRSALAAATATPCGARIRKANGTYWACTFADEFAGTALNRAWVPQVTASSGYRTGPAATQACYLDDPANISVSGGFLALTARKVSAPFVCASPSGAYTTQYTAGMVSTNGTFSQTYGRFEVRAKLPQTTAKGLQETLWLWPVNSTKYYPSSSGEIDFAEFFSEYHNLNVPFVHYTVDQSTVNTLTNSNVYTSASGCTIDYTAFNSYSLEWQPGRLTIGINGKTCLTDNYQALGLGSPAPFDQPFFVALTQALGVGTNAFDPATTPLPATTLIDYVHVWS
jgi:beta-glucanase (GH16 family)